MLWIDLAQELVEGSSEYGNESLNSLKCWEIVE
jgi:hypothetical protein